MKRCSRCKEHKPKTEFVKNKHKPDGLHYLCKPCHRHKCDIHYYKKRYGITIEEYNEKFMEQDGKCTICKRHQSEFKNRLHVDHDHTTGQIRDLLCGPCNQAFGLMNESIEALESMIEYKRKYK